MGRIDCVVRSPVGQESTAGGPMGLGSRGSEDWRSPAADPGPVLVLFIYDFNHDEVRNRWNLTVILISFSFII